MSKVISLAIVLAAVALGGATTLACGGDKPPPKTPDTVGTATAPPVSTARLPDKAPDSPTVSAVRISDEIVKACGISAPDAYFAFDSANLRPDDVRVLGQVATCFISGPLKGRVLKMVGHADPRGDSDYNMTLGQS